MSGPYSLDEIRRFWRTVGRLGDIQTLWKPGVALVAAFGVAYCVPSRWDRRYAWLDAGAAFVGTWLAALFLDRAGRRLRTAWRRWRYPPVLRLTPDGGMKGSVTLKHAGEPTTYSARGRIVRVLDGSANPAPQPFDCQLVQSDNAGSSLLLRDGEWAYVVLAEAVRGGILVRREEESDRTWVPAAGVVLELTVAGTPPLPAGAAVRRYRVTTADTRPPLLAVAEDRPVQE